MMLITGSSHLKLAVDIADKLGCECIVANTEKFPDQELKITIDKGLKGQDLIILQSTNRPVNDHIMELLLLADAAKTSACGRITAVIPYFGYSRQDKQAYEYGPVSAKLITKLIEASGIDEVITVDMHSKECEGFFNISVKNIDTADLFIASLEKNNNYIVVSPDLGGVARSSSMASKLGTELAIINKTRDLFGKCHMSDIAGNVSGKDCIIIDDIVDTGSTICEAANMLMKRGAKSIIACVTHAVFSSDCIDKVRQAGFTEFYVTDTIYHKELPSYINVLSTSDLIVKHIAKLS